MLVFIDDSGDPGFKINRGSSRYFVIALVIFKDELEAEKTAVAIKELRRSFKFPDYSGRLNNKKQPRRAISDHVPILVVPGTPPSGDSSGYRSLYLNNSISDAICK